MFVANERGSLGTEEFLDFRCLQMSYYYLSSEIERGDLAPTKLIPVDNLLILPSVVTAVSDSLTYFRRVMLFGSPFCQ
jgi:hypothetical protein